MFGLGTKFIPIVVVGIFLINRSEALDVWTNGEKMVVAAPHGGVLIWDTIPTQHNQPADISIVLNDFSTPRTVGSDETNL